MPDTTTTIPEWKLRPVSYDPHLIVEDDENEQPLVPFLHWSASFGFALNIGHTDGQPDSPLILDAQFSDMDKARGYMTREVTADQLVTFARLVLDVAEDHLKRRAVQ